MSKAYNKMKREIEVFEKEIDDNIFNVFSISNKLLQSNIKQDDPFTALPQPIAIPFNSYLKTTNIDKKHESLRVCFEVTLKLLGVIYLLVLIQKDDGKKIVNKININRPIPNGLWKSLISEGVKSASVSETFVSDHIDEVNHIRVEKLLSKLNELRIDEAHPFSSLSGMDKQDYVVNFGSLLTELLENFVFLVNYPLVYFESFSKKHGRISHIVKYLVGDAISPTEEELSSKELFNSELYLLSNKFGKSLKLSPLLIYENCDKCRKKEIFFFDFIESGKPKYGGCSQRIPKYFPEYHDDLLKLFEG